MTLTRADGATLLMPGAHGPQRRGLLRVPALSLPNADLKLTSDGPFWQDSARTTPAVADGDPIGAWDDTSGNNRHALQATAGKRPLLKLGIVNGKPVVRFDGTDDTLVSTIVAAAAQTVVLVTKKRSAVSVATRSIFSFNGVSVLATDSDVDATGFWWFANQAAGSTIIGGDAAQWNIITISFASTASCVIRLNGGAGVAFDPIDTYAGITDFNLATNGLQYIDSDIAEAHQYDPNLSLSELNAVGAFLGARYGVTWTAAT